MGIHVVISCRDVSTLVSSDALGAPWRRRLAVRMHLLMCAACRRFAAQVVALRRGAATAMRTFDGEAEGIEARAAESMTTAGA
jgi:hypothetical protein